MRQALVVLAIALQGAVLGSHATAGEPIAARYVTAYALQDRPETEQPEWYFVRTPSRIETASGDRAEIWQRANGGTISLQRVFRAHRFVVEYAPGELAAREVKPDWEALGAIVSTATLRILIQTDTQQVLGKTAQVFRGKSNGDQLEVWWLTEEGIPALVKRSNGRGTFSMRLTELHGNAPAEWPLPSSWPTSGYRLVDAADLGDMEHDPAVKHLVREEGGLGASGVGAHTH